MASGFVIRKNEYYDSVFLMGINKRLADAPGVEQTAVLMGSEANKLLLDDIGIGGPEIAAARPNDLIVAVIAASPIVVQDVIGSLDEILMTMAAGTRTADVRTLRAALERKPAANLALFSIPGEYVAHEARQALDAGLNVFIFSSNVPVEQELDLKMAGRERGLLVMGPDCGTALINGVGLGFTNVVRRGQIGAVGPSGTGLQEFTTQVHNAGAGISHAIGTGSNDLSDRIGGLTTRSALQMLEADPGTAVIAIIAKPPGPDTLALLIDEVRHFKKPVIGCFLGARRAPSSPAHLQFARTIDDAVALALQAAGMQAGELLEGEGGANEETVKSIRAGWSKEMRYLRGLFAGGTFCYQAQQILTGAGLTVYSNSPIDARYQLANPDRSREHTVIDMGDEHYTLGRPHPMIDGTERARRVLAEAADPNVAILLLDFIFGYNASSDPVGELLETMQEAQATRRRAGAELTIVASLCGTSEDPQDPRQQGRMLEACGVHVFGSNARAVRFCRRLLQGRSQS
jgi:succinyl-CoA synthetase alpha subunit